MSKALACSLYSGRGEPVDVFRDQDAIYGISVHPQDDNCFTTAVHNGSVLLYDIRAPPSEGEQLLKIPCMNFNLMSCCVSLYIFHWK